MPLIPGKQKAASIHHQLREKFASFYDEKGAVGRRYRRQDEAGTPYCITVDGQTLTDDTVTIRDRDSLRQWRVPSANIDVMIGDMISGKLQAPQGEISGGSES